MTGPAVKPLDPVKFHTLLSDTLAAVCGEGVLATAAHQTAESPAPTPATAEIRRFLDRLGTIPELWPADSLEEFFALLADKVNRAPAQVTALLNAFTARAENHRPVCGAAPRCRECRLRKFCDFGNAPLAADNLPTAQERLEKGKDLDAGECLEILLGGDKPTAADREAARAVLTRFTTAARALTGDYADFHDLRGVTPRAALRLAAAARLHRLALDGALPERKAMRSAGDFFDCYQSQLGGLEKERFLVVLLDIRLHIIRDFTPGLGSANGAQITPAEVFAPALKENAYAVAFLHNHPSGDCSPSRADESCTANLRAAAKVLGIKVLDHIIIAGGSYYSFAEHGLLENNR